MISHGDLTPMRIQVGRTRPLEDNMSNLLAQVGLELDKPVSKMLIPD